MALKQKLSITWDQTNCSISSGDNWLSISCQYKKLPTVRLRGDTEMEILNRALSDAQDYRRYVSAMLENNCANHLPATEVYAFRPEVSIERDAHKLTLYFNGGVYIITDHTVFDLWVWRQFLIVPNPPSYLELCSYDDLEQLDVSIVNNYWLLIGGGNCFVERLVSHKDARQLQKELLALAGMNHTNSVIRQLETAQLILTPTSKGCRIGDSDTLKPAYADLLRSSMVRFAVAIGEALEIAQPA